MANKIYFEVPYRELGKSDITIWITSGKRKKKSIGRLKLSKGTLDFIPRSGKKPYKVGWEYVEEMFRDFYGE